MGVGTVGYSFPGNWFRLIGCLFLSQFPPVFLVGFLLVSVLGTRLMEKVILGVGEQCKVQFSLGSGIAQLCINQSIAARKTYVNNIFHGFPWSPHHL